MDIMRANLRAEFQLKSKLLKYAIYFILLIGFSICIKQLSLCWHSSLIDLHAFRQTQTAISVFYFMKDGFSLNYETPVFGRPWSIPFEFPLYQYIVALVAMTKAFALDQAGRFVSLSFWVLSALPLYLLIRKRVPDMTSFLGILLVVWSAPTYLFWSRCFLIESCALFFSLFYIYYLIRLSSDPSCSVLCGALFFGTLGALVKATTFIIVLIPALFIVSTYVWRNWKKDELSLKYMGFLGSSLLFPALALHFWTRHADLVKSANPVGAMLTSHKLVDWNFGSLAFKMLPSTWAEICRKDFIYGFGRDSIAFTVIALLIVVIAIIRNQYRKEILLCMTGFIAGPLIFTNLFFVHEYYYYESDLYGEIALGFAIIGISKNFPLFLREGFRYGLIGIVAFSGIVAFNRTFKTFSIAAPLAVHVRNELKPLTTATKESDVVLVYGHEYDSSLPYYSQRRCIMVPSWLPDSRVQAMLSNLNPSEKIAAVVIDGEKETDRDFINQTIRKFHLNESSSETSWGKIFIAK